MANGYRINRSNYTIRTRHQTVSGGTVYERDWMATTNLGGWDSGSIPYSENNFKMVRNRIFNGERKSRGGLWMETPSGDVYWTYGDITPREDGERQNDAKANITYHSLLDFAYYGSCVELVQSTVRKIVNDFPGEMYVTGVNEFSVGGNKYFKVQNPFGIDLISRSTSDNTDKKILNGNKSNYLVVGKNISSVDVTIYVPPEAEEHEDEAIGFEWRHGNSGYYGCQAHGALWAEVKIKGEGTPLYNLKYYYFNDQPVWFCLNDGFTLSPTQETLDEFFDGLDDFGRLLLNRDTKPKYTAILDTPRETDEGFKTSRFKYTWPTTREDSDVIDVVSSQYGNYIARLLDIASFYDEYYTDNLYRMLTHDAIKNMDLTFKDERADVDDDDYEIGASNVQGLLWAYGRQFDELKREIDGIKRMVRVTYDGDGCMPNNLLNKRLNLSGWETYDVTDGLNPDIQFEYPDRDCFTDVPKKYDVHDASVSFMRNLQLNSRSIFSKKGTKYAIENLLGMFGLISYDAWINSGNSLRQPYPDYRIDEFVVTVTGNSEPIAMSGETLQVEEYNTWKANYDHTNPPVNTVDGLPVAIVEKETENGTMRYVIPWFSKNVDYDGGIYFQMYGGWMRVPETDVLLQGTTLKKLTNRWSETIKYLHTVGSIRNLREIAYDLLRDDMIVYVIDISDLEDYGYDSDTASNYFILRRKEEYDTVDGGENGWDNIPREEIFGDLATPDSDGYKVLTLESIVEDYTGNNPHVGYGKYDDGKMFLKYFETVFKGVLDKEDKEGNAFWDEHYDCETGKLVDSGITTYGFPGVMKENKDEVNLIRDNMKVWFFKGPSDSYCDGDSCENGVNTGTHNVGKNATDTTFESDLEPFDFETGETGVGTEAAANSIINVKNLRIEFFTKYDVFTEFLMKSILPYLKQVIPSTTMTEIIVTITGDGVSMLSGDTIYDIVSYVDAVEGGPASDKNDVIDGYRIYEGERDRFILTRSNDNT